MKAYRIVDEKLHSHADKCIVSRPGRFLFRGERASDAHGMGGWLGCRAGLVAWKGRKTSFPAGSCTTVPQMSGPFLTCTWCLRFSHNCWSCKVLENYRLQCEKHNWFSCSTVSLIFSVILVFVLPFHPFFRADVSGCFFIHWPFRYCTTSS